MAVAIAIVHGPFIVYWVSVGVSRSSKWNGGLSSLAARNLKIAPLHADKIRRHSLLQRVNFMRQHDGNCSIFVGCTYIRHKNKHFCSNHPELSYKKWEKMNEVQSCIQPLDAVERQAVEIKHWRLVTTFPYPVGMLRDRYREFVYKFHDIKCAYVETLHK